MPKQINTATPGQKLVKLFGLKGRFQPVLDEVIVPVVSVDQETNVAAGACGAVLNIGGTASNYAFAYLSNPSTSKSLIRVTHFIARAATGDNVHVLTNAAPLISSSATAGNRWWKEVGIPGTPVATFWTGESTTDISGAQALEIWVATGGVARAFGAPFILNPGETLQMQFGTAALTATFMGFEWTEEPLTITDP